jgi:hypothetical protein
MIRCCWVQMATHTQQLSHTATIATKKTVAEVQKLLSGHGATAVMVEYAPGDPVAMKFKIVVDREELGYSYAYRLAGRAQRHAP